MAADIKCHEDMKVQRLKMVRNNIKMALHIFSAVPQKPLVCCRVGCSAAAMAQPEPSGLESAVWSEQLWRSLVQVTAMPLHWHKPSASCKHVIY